MFTMGQQRKYVYPSLFFLVLLLIMLLRIAVAGAAERVPAPHPGRTDIGRTALGKPRPHSENDFLDAVHEFNAAVNPDTRRDRDTRDAMIMAARDDRVRNLQRDWRSANGGFFTSEPLATLRSQRQDAVASQDRRYSSERERLNNERYEELQRYRSERQILQDKMLGLNRNSPEYERLAGQLQELDLAHVDKESGYEREYRDLDVQYSMRTR